MHSHCSKYGTIVINVAITLWTFQSVWVLLHWPWTGDYPQFNAARIMPLCHEKTAPNTHHSHSTSAQLTQMMSTVGPTDLTLALIGALRDETVMSMLNKAIDREAISIVLASSSVNTSKPLDMNCHQKLTYSWSKQKILRAWSEIWCLRAVCQKVLSTYWRHARSSRWEHPWCGPGYVQ